MIFNQNLHSCLLTKRNFIDDGTVKEEWGCDGQNIKKGGCVTNGVKFVINEANAESWSCTDCEVDFCYQCISKYWKYADD